MKMPSTSPRWLATILLALLAQTESPAQAPPGMSSEDARSLEMAVQTNPNDLAALSRLLDHYYLDKSADPQEAIAERRRHILWLIENAPGGDLAGTSQATIDPAGYYLADAQGYRLASDAWRRQAAKPDARPAVLTNAAYFFKTDDKEYAVSLLKRALTLDPKNKEIGARLGDEYALMILGVTLENRNHYPLKADGALTQSALAKAAREDLAASRNPYVLAKAGYMLAWQGLIVYAAGQIPFDPLPLAVSSADRAVAIAPEEKDVAAFRENVRGFETMARGQKLVQAVPRTAVPVAPAKEIDLKQITVGMNREQVLKLGPPSGRITTDDDGHLLETFQYYVNTTPVGAVRLRDGIVSSVRIP